MGIEEALLKNWWVYPGFELELVATDLDLPVNLAFVPYPKEDPKAPLLYVTELYGQVRAITNDRTVHTYAAGLLNFEPTHEFPGSGESGLTGICVEPETGDLFWSSPAKSSSEKLKKSLTATGRSGQVLEGGR